MLKFHNKLRQKNTTSVQVHIKRQKAVFKKSKRQKRESNIFLTCVGTQNKSQNEMIDKFFYAQSDWCSSEGICLDMNFPQRLERQIVLGTDIRQKKTNKQRNEVTLWIFKQRKENQNKINHTK